MTLHGKVLQNTTDQPIRKATVALTCPTPAPFQGTATTNAEGEFTIDNVPPGRYSVLLVHPGFIASATVICPRSPRTGSYDIKIT